MIKYLALLFMVLLNLNLSAQENNTDTHYNVADSQQNIQDMGFNKKDLETEIQKIASKDKDSVKIISITPNSNLVKGDIYTFSIIAVYNLATKDQAQLQIGFNNGLDPNAYRMISEASKIVDSKTGYHIFKVKARAVNWKETGRDFNAYVNISEYPHSSRYIPLSSNSMPIKTD